MLVRFNSFNPNCLTIVKNRAANEPSRVEFWPYRVEPWLNFIELKLELELNELAILKLELELDSIWAKLELEKNKNNYFIFFKNK